MRTIRYRDRRVAACVGLALALVLSCAPPARIHAAAPDAGVSALPTLVLADHPLVGRVYDVRERRWTDAARVEAAVAGARFALLGERHGNPEHHRLQARLIAAAARERRVAVVLEQVDFPQQPAIDACRADCADFAAELGERVRWDASGWPAYELYRPIVAAVAAARLPLLAGNPGAQRVRALGRGAEADAAESAWLPDALRPLAATGRERLVADLVRGHCGMLQPARAEPMVRAQRVRDAALAATLQRGAEAEGAAVLVAGSGHARRDYGVPTLLPTAAEVVVVGFVEVAADAPEPAAYGPPDAYDFLWFTPRVDEPDPCEKMRAARP